MEGMPELNSHVLDYFSHLFTLEVQHTDPSILQKVQRKVSQHMNDFLMASYIVEDVRKAVFSIGDLKAQGPDGLHAIFFKKILAYNW